jgi:hypothetical protein
MSQGWNKYVYVFLISFLLVSGVCATTATEVFKLTRDWTAPVLINPASTATQIQMIGGGGGGFVNPTHTTYSGTRINHGAYNVETLLFGPDVCSIDETYLGTSSWINPNLITQGAGNVRSQPGSDNPNEIVYYATAGSISSIDILQGIFNGSTGESKTQNLALTQGGKTYHVTVGSAGAGLSVQTHTYIPMTDIIYSAFGIPTPTTSVLATGCGCATYIPVDSTGGAGGLSSISGDTITTITASGGLGANITGGGVGPLLSYGPAPPPTYTYVPFVASPTYDVLPGISYTTPSAVIGYSNGLPIMSAAYTDTYGRGGSGYSPNYILGGGSISYLGQSTPAYSTPGIVIITYDISQLPLTLTSSSPSQGSNLYATWGINTVDLTKSYILDIYNTDVTPMSSIERIQLSPSAITKMGNETIALSEPKYTISNEYTVFFRNYSTPANTGVYVDIAQAKFRISSSTDQIIMDPVSVNRGGTGSIRYTIGAAETNNNLYVYRVSITKGGSTYQVYPTIPSIDINGNGNNEIIATFPSELYDLSTVATPYIVKIESAPKSTPNSYSQLGFSYFNILDSSASVTPHTYNPNLGSPLMVSYAMGVEDFKLNLFNYDIIISASGGAQDGLQIDKQTLTASDQITGSKTFMLYPIVSGTTGYIGGQTYTASLVKSAKSPSTGSWEIKESLPFTVQSTTMATLTNHDLPLYEGTDTLDMGSTWSLDYVIMSGFYEPVYYTYNLHIEKTIRVNGLPLSTDIPIYDTVPPTLPGFSNSGTKSFVFDVDNYPAGTYTATLIRTQITTGVTVTLATRTLNLGAISKGSGSWNISTVVTGRAAEFTYSIPTAYYQSGHLYLVTRNAQDEDVTVVSNIVQSNTIPQTFSTANLFFVGNVYRTYIYKNYKNNGGIQDLLATSINTITVTDTPKATLTWSASRYALGGNGELTYVIDPGYQSTSYTYEARIYDQFLGAPKLRKPLTPPSGVMPFVFSELDFPIGTYTCTLIRIDNNGYESTYATSSFTISDGISITGYQISAKTGIPVGGAGMPVTVTQNGVTYSIATDANGKFDTVLLPSLVTGSPISFDTTYISLQAGGYLRSYQDHLVTGRGLDLPGNSSFRWSNRTFTPLSNTIKLNLSLIEMTSSSSRDIDGVVYDTMYGWGLGGVTVSMRNATQTLTTTTTTWGQFSFPEAQLASYETASSYNFTVTKNKYTQNPFPSGILYWYGYTYKSPKLEMDPAFTLTIHFVDSLTGDYISKANLTDRYGNFISVTNGTYVNTYNYGTYQFVVSSFGYTPKTALFTMDSDKTVNITLVKAYAAGQVQYYTPHKVRFLCKDVYGKPIPDMMAKVYGIENTLGTADFVLSMLGVNLETNPITTTLMTGSTGSDGSVVFVMLETEKYSVQYTNEALSINETRYYYPASDQYIEVFWPELQEVSILRTLHSV